MDFGLHSYCCYYWVSRFSFKWRDSGSLWLLGFILHSCWVFGFSFRWRSSPGYCCSSDAKGKSIDRTREKGVKNLWRNGGLLLGEGEKGKGKEEREREREKEKKSLVLRTCLWHGSHKDACIYIIATITRFSEIENNWKLFSISVTQSHFFENWVTEIELGNSSKQSNLLWGPQNSEIKWWKLSIGWWKHLNQTTPEWWKICIKTASKFSNRRKRIDVREEREK